MLSTLLAFALSLSAASAGGDLQLDVWNLGVPVGEYILDGQVLSMRVHESDLQRDSNGDGDLGDTVLFLHDVEGGVLHEVGVAVGPPQGGLPWAVSFGELVYFTIPEGPQSTDLNGDGDLSDRVLHSFDVGTQQLVNFGTACDLVVPGPFGIAYVAPENEEAGVDANGDADVLDFILGVTDLDGNSTGLGLATTNSKDAPPKVSSRWVIAEVKEPEQAQDLNGDGDMLDSVVHVHDLVTATTLNTGIALGLALFPVDRVRLIGDLAVARVVESAQGRDLTGDGDLDDVPSVVFNLATEATQLLGVSISEMAADGPLALLVVFEGSDGIDRNGDGDVLDLIAAAFDARTGAFQYLGIAASSFGIAVDGELAIFRVPEESQGGTDLDGDGEAEDDVWHAYSFKTGAIRNLRSTITQPHVRDGVVAYTVLENVLDIDLNGDGDEADRMPRAYVAALDQFVHSELASGYLGPQIFGRHILFQALESSNGNTDLNGDGDAFDIVFHAVQLSTGEATLLQVPQGFVSFRTSPEAVAFAVEEDAGGVDLNGDGDTLDKVVHIARVSE